MMHLRSAAWGNGLWQRCASSSLQCPWTRSIGKGRVGQSPSLSLTTSAAAPAPGINGGSTTAAIKHKHKRLVRKADRMNIDHHVSYGSGHRRSTGMVDSNTDGKLRLKAWGSWEAAARKLTGQHYDPATGLGYDGESARPGRNGGRGEGEGKGRGKGKGEGESTAALAGKHDPEPGLRPAAEFLREQLGIRR